MEKQLRAEIVEELQPLIKGCVEAQYLTLSDALKGHNKEQDEQIQDIIDSQKQILSKLNSVMPTIQEINDIRKAWSFTNRVGGWIVRFVIGVGVFMTAIYAIKNWLKKD